MVSRANPEKSARMLGWRATHRMKDVARMMVEKYL
jgi:GDP-D-mannose dehydratase